MKNEKEVYVPEAKDLWNYMMKKGKEREPAKVSQINTLNEDDITTIIATMDFFGATKHLLTQTYSDLSAKTPLAPRFRVFDWLGMMVMNKGYEKINVTAVKVIVWSWLKTDGVVEKFIDDLRKSDYQIDGSWEKVRLE